MWRCRAGLCKRSLGGIAPPAPDLSSRRLLLSPADVRMQLPCGERLVKRDENSHRHGWVRAVTATPQLCEQPGSSELSILETPAPACMGAGARVHALTALRAPQGTGCDKDQPRVNIPLGGDPAEPVVLSSPRSFAPIRECGTSQSG